MNNEPLQRPAACKVMPWSSSHEINLRHLSDEEAVAEIDEPPDEPRDQFKRNAVHKNTEHHESLLTKALQQPDEQAPTLQLRNTNRRRSLNSNISIASTADLTSDNGLTSPARSNTPSPPPPVVTLTPFASNTLKVKPTALGAADGAVEALPKKRCISFACGPKPDMKRDPISKTPQKDIPAAGAPEKTQKKTCIKFACPAKPTMRNSTPPTSSSRPIEPAVKDKSGSPSSVRKYRSPSRTRSRSNRSSTPRPSSLGGMSTSHSNKFLSANPIDLNSESSRFHEFASDEPQEDDWIRLNYSASAGRLTINDTLKKENEIRRLGKEAEEEEALDDEDGDEQVDDNEDDVDEDDDEATIHDDNFDEQDVEDDMDDGYDVDDELSVYGSDEDASDGYKTDNEIGFADSEDEDDGCDLQLWTPSRGLARSVAGERPVPRRPSLTGHKSDSSTSEVAFLSSSKTPRGRRRRTKEQPGTPELPDSTDFVCGTLDEDRALEEAYISCIAARRREKLHVIPQDIDPSFPTSEPEDEDLATRKGDKSSEENVWIHGELEDLHHEKGSDRRDKRNGRTSPKRYRSPPPKRHVSPPPKARARSPRRLFDRHSPRRVPSPVPARVKSPPASLIQGNKRQLQFTALAYHPGLTHTKSLPRAPAMFPSHLKTQKRGKAAQATNGNHIRGAIDIVKGLERKRQRRKEKFREKNYQKHCDRARKGQILDKKPQPGQGAERMREVGLAGKLGHGKFVISV